MSRMTPDPYIVRRAAEAWIRAAHHISSGGHSNGSGQGTYDALTDDDILENAGIHFATDPRLYCKYERAVRVAALELDGPSTVRRCRDCGRGPVPQRRHRCSECARTHRLRQRLAS